MGDYKWPKRMLTSWQERRNSTESTEMRWEREVVSVTKQKNVTREDAVQRQIWREVNENQ